MSEEVSQAEVPAPELEATVAPVSEVQTPEVAEDQVEQQEEKKYSQAEIDAMIGKRLAREQRKWERERTQQSAPAAPAAPVVPEQFATTEDYVEALALQKADQLLSQREQQKHQKEVIEAYHDREEEARSKYDDFEQVAYNPNLPITSDMAQAIQYSDIGPDLAYHLGANPKEAERISRLPPILQAKEIGKLEQKLSSNPPVKKTSNAPTPISPITARSTGSPAYDTTDPRSIKTMSTSDWIEAERQRQIKKQEALRNR
jgi:beta-glucosidase-like glycosyl hydrolase